MITAMHGHMAFFGAYVMIVLAMITYAAAAVFGHDRGGSARAPTGLWAFWLQIAGMFGMTMAFAAAGIAQTYLERILGLGLPRDPAQDPGALPDGARHRASCSSSASALYLYDFFFLAPGTSCGVRRPGPPTLGGAEA